MSRRGGRDPLLWNYACDYAINPILNVEVVGGAFEWPSYTGGRRMGLYEEKYEGMKAEDIYDLLIDDQKQQEKCSEAFKDDPQKGMHVIDADDELGEPNDESVVQDVTGDEEGEGQEKPGDQPGQGKPGDQPGQEKPGDQPGQGKPGEEGEGEGEGEGSANLVGKRVRITSGPNAGQIGTIQKVLPSGDIIIG
jgi:hypothetical protein